MQRQQRHHRKWWKAMLPYFTEHFGNPSSVYGFAAANKEVITKQRERIAEALGAKDNEQSSAAWRHRV